jgi:hypothetical protein
MTYPAYAPTLVRILLATVCLIFTWFFIGAVFGTDAATTEESTKQLLGIAAVGFGLAALIFP